jgi:hypothetical protein
VFATGASVATARNKRGRKDDADGGAKQSEVALREELSKLQPRGLKLRASEMGICEESIDATMDEDDVKGALVAIILDHASQFVGTPTLLQSELTGPSSGADKRPTRELGEGEGDNVCPLWHRWRWGGFTLGELQARSMLGQLGEDAEKAMQVKWHIYI